MLGLAVLFGGGAGYVLSGIHDVAATGREPGALAWVLGTTMERSVARRARGVALPPDLADRARALRGAAHFEEMCAVCHGAPGVEAGEIGAGLNPRAPELSNEAGEWNEHELFWIMKHGVRMTGMPAFGTTHGDAELWDMVAFVRLLPGMTPAQYREWLDAARPAGAEDAAPAGHTHSPAGHTHAPGTPPHSH